MLSMNTMIEDLLLDEYVNDVILVTVYKCGHESKYYATYDDSILEKHLGEFVKYEIVEDYKITKKMISDKAILVYQEVEYRCASCWSWEEIRMYCDELPKPIGFDKVTKYHGLAAFSGADTMLLVLNNLKTINEHPEYQICCSTKALGDIGVVIEGDTLVASNVDLWTYIDPEKDNRRYFLYKDGLKNQRANGIIYNASELDDTLWDHSEIVTENNKIAYILLKETHKYDNKELELLKDTANKLNIEIKMI